MDQHYIELYELAKAEKLVKKHGIYGALSKSAKKEFDGAVAKVKKEKKEKARELDKNQ